MLKDLIKFIEKVMDDIVAAAIVATGLYMTTHTDFQNGWMLITFGAGYLFGKNKPKLGR